MGEWSIEHNAKPLLVNAERSSHWSARAAATAEWRTAFGWLAREAKIPALASIEVVVEHFTKTQQMPDVCACLPAAKAGIDALVDVGVIPDDGPWWVRSVTFLAPVFTGRDGVRLTVRGEPDPTR